MFHQAWDEFSEPRYEKIHERVQSEEQSGWQSISSCARSHDKQPATLLRMFRIAYGRGKDLGTCIPGASFTRLSNAVVPFHIHVNLSAVRLIDPEYHSSLLTLPFLFPLQRRPSYREEEAPVGSSFDSTNGIRDAAAGFSSDSHTYFFRAAIYRRFGRETEKPRCHVNSGRGMVLLARRGLIIILDSGGLGPKILLAHPQL